MSKHAITMIPHAGDTSLYLKTLLFNKYKHIIVNMKKNEITRNPTPLIQRGMVFCLLSSSFFNKNLKNKQTIILT